MAAPWAEACRQQYGQGYVWEVMISETWYREPGPGLVGGHRGQDARPARGRRHSDRFPRSLRAVKGVARIPEPRTQDKTGAGDALVAATATLSLPAPMMLTPEKSFWQLRALAMWECRFQGFDMKGWITA